MPEHLEDLTIQVLTAIDRRELRAQLSEPQSELIR